MADLSEKEITPKGWWYNPSSRLYFLDVDNDPIEKYRGSLVAGNFHQSMFLQVRNGVPLKPGLEAGIYFSFGFTRGNWGGYESVLFDPRTRVEQIDSQQWKAKGDGLEFRELAKHSASHIYHHWQTFCTAPNLEQHRESLDYLFEILAKQEEKKNRFRIVR